MCGSVEQTVRTTPSRLISIVRRSTSGGVIATVPLLPTPALASTTSMPPNAATVPATAPSTCAWSVTSASNQAARSPSSSASARKRSGSSPTSETRAPFATARRAVSAPMPRAAPVISTTLFSSPMRPTYPLGTTPYRARKVSDTFLARGGGRGGGAAGEAPELPRLRLGEPVRPPLRLHEQLPDLLALVSRERIPARLQPEEDDRGAAAQLAPGDLLGLRQGTAAQRGHAAQGTRPRCPIRSGSRHAVIDRVGLGGDHRAVARRVRDALLDPLEAAVQHAHGARVVRVVRVGPQLVEEPVHAPAGLLAEQVGELEGLLGEVGALGLDRVRVRRGGRDRVQLGADVHDPPEECLLLLELGLPASHRVERRARELARVALDEAQVRGQRAELVVGSGLEAVADGQA